MGEAIRVPEHLLAKNQLASPENIAVFEAAQKGSVRDLKKALDNGAKPDFFYHPEEFKNALHIAAENGSMDVVEELLKAGAVVDCIVPSTQSTALLLGVSNGHMDVTRKLIAEGANVKHANCYGNTALHEAIRTRHFDIAKILLEAGTNVNAVNRKGSTPLHFLCYDEAPSNAQASLTFARSLVAAGADVNMRDHRGLTPLLVCCASGRLDLIQFLIEEGADPAVKDNSNQTAYDTAKFYNNTQIMDRFAEESPASRFK